MLNKIPVLDKGHVALLSTSLPRKSFLKIQNKFFRGSLDDRMLDMVQLHVEVKCPLFVQLTLTESNLQAIPLQVKTIEAYVPTVDEVGARDLETSKLIQQDIEQTTKALLLNPKAYQMDGCDIFVSQTIAPVSTYNTILVTGSIRDFVKFANRKNMPVVIDQYRAAVADIILAEWDFLWEFIDGKKEKGS